MRKRAYHFIVTLVVACICYISLIEIHKFDFTTSTHAYRYPDSKSITTHEPYQPTKAPSVYDNCSDAFQDWYSSRTSWSDELRFYVQKNCLKDTTRVCRKGTLLGDRIKVDKSFTTLSKLSENNAHQKLSFRGGWWSPENCIPRRHVAVIITYRNREQHLPILLRHLLPILMRIGDIHFRVFLVEQVDSYTFNKGKLYNIGFTESRKHFPYDCYILHDIDLLVENDNVPFGCEESPMHLSVAIDYFKYQLPYYVLVGGVLMMTSEDYSNINGFSNSFWYWGGEDDNLYTRMLSQNMTLKRPPIATARYKQLGHPKRHLVERKRTSNGFVTHAESHLKTDGLSHLQYKVLSIQDEDFFTHIRVDVQKEKDRLFGALENFNSTTES